MRKEHEKCLEIMFHLNAHIEPDLIPTSSSSCSRICSSFWDHGWYLHLASMNILVFEYFGNYLFARETGFGEIFWRRPDVDAVVYLQCQLLLLLQNNSCCCCCTITASHIAITASLYYRAKKYNKKTVWCPSSAWERFFWAWTRCSNCFSIWFYNDDRIKGWTIYKSTWRQLKASLTPWSELNRRVCLWQHYV